MSKLAFAILVVFVMGVACVTAQETVIDAQSQPSNDEEHTKWISDVLTSIATIKPGMTRRELFGVFAEEGGLSTRKHKTYVYRHCPYIKVDVEFSPVDETGQNAMTENPRDRIVSISRPYLEYAIMD
jgi:hypothetical protein